MTEGGVKFVEKSFWGGSYLFEDLAIILGFYDGHIKGTEGDFEGRRYPPEKEKYITYINILRRMSVDCDCAGTDAEEPKARDIGILASTDILAVDQASIDLVYKLPKKELKDLKERIESRKGLHQLTYGEQIGIGSRKYQLEEVK